MKNVAVMEGNVVANIIVCADDYVLKENEIEYFEDNYACIGGDYDGGFFYAPQPFPSWTKSNGQWVPPVAPPEVNRETNPDNKALIWDEANQSWYFV